MTKQDDMTTGKFMSIKFTTESQDSKYQVT